MLRRKAEDEGIYLSHKTNDPVLIHIKTNSSQPWIFPHFIIQEGKSKIHDKWRSLRNENKLFIEKSLKMSCQRLLIARQASYSTKNRGMGLNEQL